MKKIMIVASLIVGVLGLFFIGNFVLSMGENPQAVSPDIYSFTLKDLDGNSHNLADYKGKVVFLNFWASWCPPCREEMPAMQKMYVSWDKNKYVMLAINTGEDKRTVKEFAGKNGYTFPILLDKDGRVARTYKITGIPTTFIIDGEGKVVSKIVGARDWTEADIKIIVE